MQNYGHARGIDIYRGQPTHNVERSQARDGNIYDYPLWFTLHRSLYTLALVTIAGGIGLVIDDCHDYRLH